MFKQFLSSINQLPAHLIHTLSNERGEVGDGDGDDDGKGAAGEVQQQLTDLQAKFDVIAGEHETLKVSKSDLEHRLDEADKELLSDEYLNFKDGKSRKGSSDDSDSKGGDLNIDLDRASNKEIAGFIEKKYKGDLDVAVKDIRKELTLSKQSIGLMAAQFDVALTTLKHDGRDGKASFAEHQKAIFEVAKANPKWTAEKCYQQFILESKSKLEADALAKKKKAEDEEKAATERDGVPASTSTGKELSKDDAADLAYKKAFGNSE